jgi:hypothetical protein
MMPPVASLPTDIVVAKLVVIAPTETSMKKEDNESLSDRKFMISACQVVMTIIVMVGRCHETWFGQSGIILEATRTATGPKQQY